MQGETKICVQAHYVMENICINKHCLHKETYNLLGLNYESLHAFSPKIVRKMAENLEKIGIWCSLLVMMLSDIFRVQG